jgi:23S rRNA (uracil1939-C5)-methyltransferase
VDARLDRPPKNYRPPVRSELVAGAFDAHGIARGSINGKPVELERAIPGELVDVEIFGKRRRWARIVSVLSPAADRVDAPCPAFERGCGGCQWQMIEYRSQLDRKVEGARTALAGSGLDLPITAVHEAADPWRYRGTAALSLGYRAGFRRHGSQSIVELEDCPIANVMIGRLAAHLNRGITQEKIPNFRGQMSVEIRAGYMGEQEVVHTCILPAPGSPHAGTDAVDQLAAWLGESPDVAGVVYRHRQEPPRLLRGEEFIEVQLLGTRLCVTAATFFQTNISMVERLLASLLREARTGPNVVAVDVYGGVGTFGLALAGACREVIEIELDPTSIEAASRAAQQAHLSNVRFIGEAAETALGGLEAADIVIVDPPRSGLTPKTIAALRDLRPAQILYVSCLAQSLARDVAELMLSGYRSGGVELFDFYPQTYHAELFTALTL